MARDSKNECGDSRIWGRPYDKFNDACLFHDFHYRQKHDIERAGQHVPYSRIEIDKAFLQLMLKEATTRTQKLQAYFYYRLVRTFGGFWWKR